MTSKLKQSVVELLKRTSTAPGYLIYIDFSPPIRLSTRGTVTYQGAVWNSANIAISGVSADSAPNQKATILIADYDAAMTAMLFNNSVADRQIIIYAFDGDVTDSHVEMIYGVGGAVSGDAYNNIKISVANLSSRTIFIPQKRIAPEFGFNHVPPNGMVIKTATGTITLRNRYN